METRLAIATILSTSVLDWGVEGERRFALAAVLADRLSATEDGRWQVRDVGPQPIDVSQEALVYLAEKGLIELRDNGVAITCLGAGVLYDVEHRAG